MRIYIKTYTWPLNDGDIQTVIEYIIGGEEIPVAVIRHPIAGTWRAIDIWGGECRGCQVETDQWIRERIALYFPNTKIHYTATKIHYTA